MKPRTAAAFLGLALYSLGLIGAVLLSAGNAGAAEPQRFFDDFGYGNVDQLAKEGGWTLREGPGHPGVEGAQWGANAITLAPDEAQPGNQLLRLSARTDGTGSSGPV